MNSLIITGVLTGILFLLCVWILILIDQLSNIRKQNSLLKAAGISAGVFIIIAFLAPFFFTSSSYFTSDAFKDNGEIGDAIGGLMNPFIGIAAVIVTGLAFYAQYQANQELRKAGGLQVKQYQLDKFESQFYEMLRLHKENVNEMSIEGYEYKTEIEEKK